jgi:hypothetical protein
MNATSPVGGQAPQSCGQVLQVSPPLQLPFGHVGHAPQSCGQVLHVSPPLQLPFGHVGHAPQSCGQVLHVSPPAQVRSPQPLGVPLTTTLSMSTVDVSGASVLPFRNPPMVMVCEPGERFGLVKLKVPEVAPFAPHTRATYGFAPLPMVVESIIMRTSVHSVASKKPELEI